MSADISQDPHRTTGTMPEGEALIRNVSARQQVGRIWQAVLFGCTILGILILLLLLWNVVNDAFGGIATQSEIAAAEIYSDREPESLSQAELITILEENLRSRVLRNVTREQPLEERSTENLIELIETEVIRSEVVAIYTLSEYLFNRDGIEAALVEEFPRAELEFRSWVSTDFVATPMSSRPVDAGVRTALLGSLWLLLITILIAFPLGIGAALYLEEYTSIKPFDERNPVGRRANAIIARLSGIIQTNIYNLSGVPSIIYGMLGLAIFVRALEAFTSGSVFGAGSGGDTLNGRTVLSAGMTMALLVLPIVIISSQEAIRAVPSSIRQASFGLGATRWQTIWTVVLPNALPGILTGTILAISRAIGETAPLIVVGASTFIVTDPEGPFAKFTALPIQIYNWTARPQDEFRAIAAAAIIVLMTLLLSLNAVAIILRNYLRSKRVAS
ncbi:MAG: phosphate ABC transporter permease PstA [Oscillochloris sp.]|nr:phosphate ABC transporter permease PstA [Oscillochloris sp.]